MSAPKIPDYKILCPICGDDGRGCWRCESHGQITSDDERRAVPRKTGRDLYLAHVAEVNGLTHAIAVQADQIDALLRENRGLRKIVHDQARLLDRAIPRPSPTENPISNRAVGGAPQSKEVQ